MHAARTPTSLTEETDGSRRDLPDAVTTRTGGAADQFADQEILAFERQWWKYAGAKEQAIRDLFDMSATRYYQLLNSLIDNPAALAHDLMLVKRLRRLRTARQRQRSARRLGLDLTPAATYGRERERGSAARCSSPRSPLGARADCRPRPDRCLPRTVRRAGRRELTSQPSSAPTAAADADSSASASPSAGTPSPTPPRLLITEIVRARRRGVVGIVVG